MTLTDGGFLNVNSSASGDAGTIGVAARSMSLTGGSIVARAAVASGGIVTVDARDSLTLFDSDISASVAGGAGDGGNVALRGGSLILLSRSGVTATAFEGDGGRIQLSTGALIVDAESEVNASSTLGVDGTVEVNSPETDVEAAAQLTATGYVDAAGLLRGRCSAVGGSVASELVVVDGDGLPQRPDALQAEPVVEGAQRAEAPSLAFASECGGD